ncbi:UNVERIFIED_ORG: hypothetical protein BCL66_10613 [Martelella mediterranea]
MTNLGNGVVSNKAVLVALAVLPDGTRDVLNGRLQASGRAKFGMAITGGEMWEPIATVMMGGLGLAAFWVPALYRTLMREKQ